MQRRSSGLFLLIVGAIFSHLMMNTTAAYAENAGMSQGWSYEETDTAKAVEKALGS